MTRNRGKRCHEIFLNSISSSLTPSSSKALFDPSKTSHSNAIYLIAVMFLFLRKIVFLFPHLPYRYGIERLHITFYIG